MNRSQLEGSAEAVKWSICSDSSLQWLTACSTKVEVVEEINSGNIWSLEHREALLHVLKNTSAITAAVVEENYWFTTDSIETYFGLRDNITSMVDSMDVLEANLCEVLQKFWNASLTPTKFKRLFKEPSQTRKTWSTNIYSFKYSFHWNVQYYCVCNKLIATMQTTFCSQFYNSYIRKLPHRLLASQINKNRYSQSTCNELTSLKCFSPQFIRLILAGFILTSAIFFMNYFPNYRFLKKGENQGNCLVLPHASYGSVIHLENGCSESWE